MPQNMDVEAPFKATSPDQVIYVYFSHLYAVSIISISVPNGPQWILVLRTMRIFRIIRCARTASLFLCIVYAESSNKKGSRGKKLSKIQEHLRVCSRLCSASALVCSKFILLNRLFNKLRSLRTIINALLSALVMVSQVYP